MNHVVLTGQVVELAAMRYTPAGAPAIDLRIAHESEVAEAGTPRKVSLQLSAVAIGEIAERIARLAVGTEVQASGFLGKQRNGRGVVLHINDCVPIVNGTESR